jgi:hypothetical protein
MVTIKKLFRYLIDSDYRFTINANRFGMYKGMPDEAYLKRTFKACFGYVPDLENPRTFNEKLQWLKLHDRKDIYTTMVDKYEAKKYVSHVIGEKYVIPTLGVWDHFDDIDFSKLPTSFVLKCTHDSGSVVLVRDKYHWDKEAAKKLLEHGLSRNYYWSGREWPYKNVKPRILAEEMVDMNPVDYKWICMKGEPEVLCMCMDRQKGDLTFNYYDMNFNLLPFEWVHPNIKTGGVKRPENFDEMKKLAQKLSKDIPEVRVDFYDINGQVYFGELTFYHQSGFAPFSPEGWDLKLGQLLDLTDIKRE